ncbi:MAG: tripartite tricarboxylate transporter substrate binding protein [Clostridia bacterium]
MKKLRVISMVLTLTLLVVAITGCGGTTKPADEKPAPQSNEPVAQSSEPAPKAAWTPEKPIEFLVPMSAGGGSDVFSRTIVKIINDNKLMPQPVVVVNKPGGSGSIGYTYLSEKKGNPYYFGTVSSSFYTAPLTGGSPVSLEDFTHLGLMCKDPLVMVVNGQSDLKTIEDVIEAAKANPGQLNGAGSSNASDDAIACYIFRDEAGVDMSYVPFQGGGDVLTAILGGHVDFAFVSPIECEEQIKSGNLVPVATTADKRLDILPDVPTFTEKGMNVVLQQARGLVMPKDVPAEAVAYYEDVLKKVFDTPEWKEYVSKNAMVYVYMNSTDYNKFSYDLNGVYKTYIDKFVNNK